MRTHQWMAGCLLPIFATVPSQASERRITHDQLPAIVQASADKESQGGEVKGYTTEVENGRRVYEVETVIGGHTRDVEIAADGTINEVEEEIAIGSLPQNVRDALMSKAKAARIEKVESLKKKGRLVAYEATTDRAGKRGEFQVGPAGETLKHEE